MYHNGEDISAYLDGELPADAAREVERRLEADITTREELEHLRRLRRTLHDAEEPDFHAGHERVWMSLEDRLGLKPPLWRRRVSLPYPAVAAAAVAVFALAGLLIWMPGPSGAGVGEFDQAAATAADAQIAVGGIDGE
ncbi:MAG: anti-sigma factor family protein, partial [Spirochaetaceae bacterium]